MRTYVPEGREAEALSQGPKWVVVDAAGQVLGRLATTVARVLIGKDKPSSLPTWIAAIMWWSSTRRRFVSRATSSTRKCTAATAVIPGGLKEVPGKAHSCASRADWMVREAVLGMLPKNKLRASRAKKLRVYLDEKGLARHAGQKPQPLAL